MVSGCSFQSILSVALFAAAAATTGAELHPRHHIYRSFQREFEEGARFAEMGVTLRAFGVCNTASGRGAPYSDYPNVWLGFGQYDWDACDRQFDDLIRTSPKTRFMVLVDLNTPLWFARKLNMDSFTMLSHTAAQARWRTETTRYLKDFLTHVEGKYGDRTVAYVLLGGRTTEWLEHDQGIQSRAKNLAWRDWCRKTGTQHGPVPPDENSLGVAAFENVVYDPATERAKIDYWRFHNSLVADTVLDFAHTARAIVGKTKEIGTFFGYYYICSQHLSASNHLDYERVIASDDIDFFSSPATYTERACGFGTGSMAVNGTIRRYGKRLIHEIDYWPHDLALPWRTAARDYFHSASDDIAGNTRDAAFAFVNGASWWWFDQYGKYYATPGMHERIRRLAEIESADVVRTPPKDVADVLLVADPQSAYLMAPARGRHPEKIDPIGSFGENLRNRLNVTGCAYETCSFNDLGALDLARFKLILLPATIEITPARADLLKKRVCTAGRTVVWTYAPGLSDGQTLDPARVEAWAGVPFKTRSLSPTTMPGGWKSVYAYDWKDLTPSVLRTIAADAGVFFYVDDLWPVAANDRHLAVHCKTGGRKTVYLPQRCTKVVELLSNRVVATDCTSFEDDFSSPDTKLYEFVVDSSLSRKNARLQSAP